MHWYTFRGSKNKNTPELIARAQQLNTSNRYLKCIYTHTHTWVPSILSRSQHLNSEYLKDAVFKYYIYQVSTAKYYWKYVWAGMVSHIAIDRCGWPGESVVYVLIRTCFLAAQMQQIFSCIFMLHNIETIYTLYSHWVIKSEHLFALSSTSTWRRGCALCRLHPYMYIYTTSNLVTRVCCRVYGNLASADDGEGVLKPVETMRARAHMSRLRINDQDWCQRVRAIGVKNIHLCCFSGRGDIFLLFSCN